MSPVTPDGTVPGRAQHAPAPAGAPREVPIPFAAFAGPARLPDGQALPGHGLDETVVDLDSTALDAAARARAAALGAVPVPAVPLPEGPVPDVASQDVASRDVASRDVVWPAGTGAVPADPPTAPVPVPVPTAPVGSTLVVVRAPVTDANGCEDFATVLCRRMAGAAAPELAAACRPELPVDAPDAHRIRHLLEDLARRRAVVDYWADVDRARAGCAAGLDLRISAHDTPDGAVLVLVVPPRHLDLVLAETDALGARHLATVTDQTRPADAGVWRDAVRSRLAGADGRALVFAGQQHAGPRHTVHELLQLTEIDAVTSAHGPVHPDDVVETLGHLRPRYADGRLVLRCGHRDAHTLVPLETRHVPAGCC